MSAPYPRVASAGATDCKERLAKVANRRGPGRIEAEGQGRHLPIQFGGGVGSASADARRLPTRASGMDRWIEFDAKGVTKCPSRSIAVN